MLSVGEWDSLLLIFQPILLICDHISQFQAAQRSGLSEPSCISLIWLPQAAAVNAGQTTGPLGDLHRRGCGTLISSCCWLRKCCPGHSVVHIIKLKGNPVARMRRALAGMKNTLPKRRGGLLSHSPNARWKGMVRFGQKWRKQHVKGAGGRRLCNMFPCVSKTKTCLIMYHQWHVNVFMSFMPSVGLISSFRDFIH